MSDTPAALPDEAVLTPEPPSLHGCPISDSCGQTVIHPSRQQYVDVVRALLDEGYEMCVDLTATDYLRMPQRTLPDGVAAELAVKFLVMARAFPGPVFDFFGRDDVAIAVRVLAIWLAGE